MEYPKTSKDLLQHLRERRFAHDARISGVLRDRTSFWPKEFSRLELNGIEYRSIIVWTCSHCHIGGVSTSGTENGRVIECWHCTQCNEHAEFKAVTNLR